ncbi:twin-arginine translocase TatA/TatE family subunit [Paenibacillus psychroresistens]|uniref:Sec-independent protein translocase protein TatA n=1 Tax=Paenibacillus psychroresistens TaxID=1778678 RepID=A0A6B8RT52_9BACL|nr:twin-arginine translocase TatA/TatE family subunit [Paenibacillus psychroresistens]QGQ98496.1 twin-arginine translocase TatA/TatE family subunit [Paenibacillus psychroresistens]
MGAFGPIHIILIVIVALLLFGPSKLPELGKAFGKTLREFKNGTKDIMNDNDETPQVQPGTRKEIRSEKANVQEAQFREVSEVSTEEKVEKKPQDSRRLPD